MMKSIALLIGNSDNKLTQREWMFFCGEIKRAIAYYIWHNNTPKGRGKIHFSAPSIGWKEWQNACWVFEIEESEIEKLKTRITEIRKSKYQDSVAWIEGETFFL